MNNRRKIIEQCIEEGYSTRECKTNKRSALKEAADRLNLSYETLRSWWYENKEKEIPLVEYQELPPEDLDIIEILDFLEDRNTTRIENSRAKQWREIKINSNEPCIIAFVGDPHLDSPGCDLKTLRNDLALLNQKNIYAFSIGDVHDNWVGNLQRLYANSDVSRNTAIKLINWFMNESGVNWLGFVNGNHDLWNNGNELLSSLNKKHILMEDWELKINLKFPSNMEIPIWIAHDFKGKSNFNKVHGLVKAARERQFAKIIVSGHTHDFGYYMEEMPDNNYVYHALRARGYKFNDEHALISGFPESKYGNTVCAVINPRATTIIDEITIFPNIHKAILYKKALELIFR